jgi:phosphopantetheinyl transferase (holo-ACP synthase)
MDSELRLAAILERVTGKVPGTGVVSLSSVQRGVVSSLCRREGIAIDAHVLNRTFTVSQLLGRGGDSAAPSVTAMPDPQLAAAKGSEPATVGCDIQSIAEFAGLIQAKDFKSCPFLTDHLSLEEIAYCEGQKDPVSSLCGVFAAKEAVFKAGRAVPLAQIVIEHRDGAPKTRGYAVSISHSKDYCMAVAVAIAAPVNTPMAAAQPGAAPRTLAAPDGERIFGGVGLLYHAAVLSALGWLIWRALHGR